MAPFHSFERLWKPRILQEADLSNWEELAEIPIDSIFHEGLAAGTLGLLVAPGGTGKSYLALQLALSVALKRPLMPGFTPTRPGPVLCCFGEDDSAEIARRLRRICTAHQIPPQAITNACQQGRLAIICGTSEPLLSFGYSGMPQSTEARNELTELVRERGFRLIVMDPVVAWVGVPNENDNSQMQHAAKVLIDLAKASGGAVLAVHHQAKSSSRANEKTVSTGRGASSLTDASRWQATLYPLEGNPRSIPEAERHQYLELHIGKNSYGPRPGNPLYLKRVHGALVGIDLDITGQTELLNAVIEELTEHPVILTRSEAARRGGGEAIKFRERLSNRLGWAPTQPKLHDAIQKGIETGVLGELDETGGVGKPRRNLVVLDNLVN